MIQYVLHSANIYKLLLIMILLQPQENAKPLKAQCNTQRNQKTLCIHYLPKTQVVHR